MRTPARQAGHPAPVPPRLSVEMGFAMLAGGDLASRQVAKLHAQAFTFTAEIDR
ncbi:hypothetical protein JCM19379_04730 [Methyloparacoccus murrellii]|jgi:hypothetical protein